MSLLADEPKLNKHTTVASVPRLVRIKDLYARALSMLRSLTSFESPSDKLIRCIHAIMYATRNYEARGPMAAESYLQFPVFVETLHETARY